MHKLRLSSVLCRWLPPLWLAAGRALADTPQEQMSTALADWVAGQNGVSAAQVRVVPPDPRVAVQPCAGGFSFDYPFVNRENVRVRCLKPKWQLFVKVGFAPAAQPVEATPAPRAATASTSPSAALAENRQVVVAAVNLSPGQVLQPEMLKLEQAEPDKVNRAHYAEIAGLNGFEVLRTIRAGEPLRQSDVKPALMVRRGDRVLMTVGTQGSFQISVTAEALQDARLGDQVKLRNTESGRTLSAVVTGKGTARGL